GKFRGSQLDDAQLIGAVGAGTIPELADATRIPEPLDSLRRSMLAAEPESRVPDARTARDLLRRCPGYRDASPQLQALVRWHPRVAPSDCGYQSAESGVWPCMPRTYGDLCNRRRLAALAVALGGLCVGCLGVGL